MGGSVTGLAADEVDYHGDSGTVEPRGNVRIQTQTPAQGILSAIAMFQQQSAKPLVGLWGLAMATELAA